jgi:hypothetical protein
MTDKKTLRAYATLFILLTVLFFVRVSAQALATVFQLPFLPSLSEWTTPSKSPFATSGLVPYPLLFSSQIVILLFQAKVCKDFLTGRGYFLSLRRTTGNVITWTSYVYFISMALRYVVTMALHPERRWFGHTVPILLHFVLAGFLFTLGRFHTERAPIL